MQILITIIIVCPEIESKVKVCIYKNARIINITGDDDSDIGAADEVAKERFSFCIVL